MPGNLKLQREIYETNTYKGRVLQGMLLPKSLNSWPQGVSTKWVKRPERRNLNIWPLIYSLAFGRSEFALPPKFEALSIMQVRFYASLQIGGPSSS